MSNTRPHRFYVLTNAEQGAWGRMRGTACDLEAARTAEVIFDDIDAPPQMARSSVNGDMVVDFPRPMPDFPRVDLECAYCGQPLGDNNEPIREGPHKGLRPTDLTAYCAASGRDEQVVISAKRIDN